MQGSQRGSDQNMDNCHDIVRLHGGGDVYIECQGQDLFALLQQDDPIWQCIWRVYVARSGQEYWQSVLFWPVYLFPTCWNEYDVDGLSIRNVHGCELGQYCEKRRLFLIQNHNWRALALEKVSVQIESSVCDSKGNSTTGTVAEDPIFFPADWGRAGFCAVCRDPGKFLGLTVILEPNCGAEFHSLFD